MHAEFRPGLTVRTALNGSGWLSRMRMRRRLGAPVALLAAIGALLGSATPAAASIQFDGQWGSASLPPPLGPADGSFSAPSRAATDSSNNVYVTDSGNSRVQKFSSTGTFLSKFGTLGIGNGQFLTGSASGVAIDSAGNVYVVDKLSNRVEKFNSAGTFVTAWGTLGTGNAQFNAPTGIAVDPSSGNVYVADTGNNRIQEFTSGGGYLTQWGSVGTGDGNFTSPSGVAVDSTGDVYVADSGNSRIQKFTPTGSFITKWGSLGTGDGQFGATTTTTLDLAVGSSDNVIVVDPTNNRVQKFRPIGTFITKWGTAGSGNGQFTLPSGVAISSADEVYVVDSGNSRVERFHETDTSAPDTTIDSGPSGTTNANVSFTFSTSESPLLGFECRLDSAEWEACGASKSYSNLSEGSHTVEVRAVDAAGNPDPSPVSRTWTVDRTPPNTTINTGPSGTTNDASPSFTFSSSEPNSSFECRLDSNQESDFHSCSSPKSYSSLADGDHTVDVRATDAVGNTDQTPASRSFTVDATPAYGHGTRPAPPPRPNHDAGAGQLVRRRQPHHPGKPQIRPPETQLSRGRVGSVVIGARQHLSPGHHDPAEPRHPGPVRGPLPRSGGQREHLQGGSILHPGAGPGDGRDLRGDLGHAVPKRCLRGHGQDLERGRCDRHVRLRGKERGRGHAPALDARLGEDLPRPRDHIWQLQDGRP